jgi:beta-lactamase class A
MARVRIIISKVLLAISLLTMYTIPVRGEVPGGEKLLDSTVVEKMVYHYNLAYDGIVKISDESEKVSLLEDELRSVIGDKIGQVGVVYFDLNSKDTIAINGEQSFVAASTVKVPVNMALLNFVERGIIDINDALLYQDYDYEEGTGILQGLDLSEPIPITELVVDSIIYSDNIATNMLIDKIGFYEMKAEFQEMLGHSIEFENNYITPIDAVEFLKQLYYNPQANPYYLWLIDIMKNTIFHDRIDRDIPAHIVAHKIGNYDSYANDIGIVFTERPYILAIYTEDITDDAEDLIAALSKVVYDYQMGSDPWE